MDVPYSSSDSSTAYRKDNVLKIFLGSLFEFCKSPGLGFVQMVFNRYLADIFTKVYGQGKVIVIKRPPFRGLREIFEHLFNTSHKFMGRH